MFYKPLAGVSGQPCTDLSLLVFSEALSKRREHLFAPHLHPAQVTSVTYLGVTRPADRLLTRRVYKQRRCPPLSNSFITSTLYSAR
jgi:hypothetical protein